MVIEICMIFKFYCRIPGSDYFLCKYIELYAAQNQVLQLECSFSFIVLINLGLSPMQCLPFIPLHGLVFLSVSVPAEPPPQECETVTSDSGPSSARTLIFERVTINTVVCRKMWKQVEWLGLGKKNNLAVPRD